MRDRRRDPVFRSGKQYWDIGRVLDAFHKVRHAVLAVDVASQFSEGYGEEMSDIWPVDVTEAQTVAIRDAFLGSMRDSDLPYHEQDVKNICDPLIWFEDGRIGARAAGRSSY